MHALVGLDHIVVGAPVVHARQPTGPRVGFGPYAKGHTMTGAAGYMALVLAEAVAARSRSSGSAPCGTRSSGGSSRSRPRSCSCSPPEPGSRPAPRRSRGRFGRWAETLTLTKRGRGRDLVLLLLAKQRLPARIVGVASVGISIAALVSMAGTGRQSFPIALFQLLAGAAFLGSITVGLLLGHWYSPTAV